jgi:hypothetical protein
VTRPSGRRGVLSDRPVVVAGSSGCGGGPCWSWSDRLSRGLSDGADGPRSLGEAASPGPTNHVLDWFHLAMRIQHVAEAATGWPDATETDLQAGARHQKHRPRKQCHDHGKRVRHSGQRSSGGFPGPANDNKVANRQAGANLTCSSHFLRAYTCNGCMRYYLSTPDRV